MGHIAFHRMDQHVDRIAFHFHAPAVHGFFELASGQYGAASL
jgi:hypothetical protein